MTPAEGLPESMKKRLRMNLSVRGDSGEWIIRTLESRMLREATEPFNTVDIQPGDVLIDNNLYGQYAGEVQIARKPMKNYGKTNVVGHIDPREVELLPLHEGLHPVRFQLLKTRKEGASPCLSRRIFSGAVLPLPTSVKAAGTRAARALPLRTCRPPVP